jgi:cysteinyl-tRNA synthetase
VREVRLRDTLSGDVRPLDLREPGKVGIYACGATVYSRIHVGNARAFVIPMLFARFLGHEGYHPTLVINVTDVNDKIYGAAREAGVPSAEHAREMTRLYLEDTSRLAIGRPDHEPLATETIDEIVELIEALIDGGHAYESGGDVYYRVRSFPGYGKLSNRDPEQMDQGEEAGSAELKEDPLDFALWKATKPGEDTSWPSPWGDGRPGWHIECSAMAEKYPGAAPTSSFPITRMRSRRPRRRGACPWRGCGCTREWSRRAPRRKWPNRSATCSCSTRRSTATGRRRSSAS